jgi:hypothetical protein
MTTAYQWTVRGDVGVGGRLVRKLAATGKILLAMERKETLSEHVESAMVERMLTGAQVQDPGVVVSTP